MGSFITGILGSSLGPLKVKYWLMILVALGMVLGAWVKIADNAEKRKLDTAKEAGASSAIIEGQQQTLDQLTEANNAEQEMDRAGERSRERFDECLRNARNAGSCERFRPAE